jgi:outer membrane protein assembly factor BamB
MSRTSGLVVSLLTAAALAAGALLVPAKPALGDDARPDGPDKRRPRFSTLVTLPTSDDLESKLEIAPAYIKGGDWATATRVLQWVLDHPEDAFVPVRRPGPDGKEAVGWVSARAEADRLLATLPPKGREFYEVQHGARAAGLLAAARKAGDLLQLAQVVERYRHTAAGRQAADLLGTHHLDRGQYGIAARYFRGLLARPEVDKLAPLTLFKAAVAFRRAGDETSATAAWKLLAARSPAGLRIGGREVALAELKKELTRAPDGARQDAAAVAWAVFRGSADRSAAAAGALSALREGWDRPTVGSGPAADWVEGALARLKERGQPALPAAAPLAALGKVIYRSHRGVHAVEAATGRLLWESPLRGSLEELADDPASLAHAGDWAASVLQAFPNALIENSTVGALSADARHVYAVEDLALPTVPKNYSAFVYKSGAGLHFTYAPELTNAVYHSRLLAFDLESGLALWQAGGRGEAKGGPLHDAHFLGPPLPLAGKLYALVEKEQALRLVCLDPADGRPCWSQTLAVPKQNVLIDGARRTWAAHLAHAEGVLVCPTNAGAVVAVDMASRSLRWAHSYREEPPPPPLPPGRFKVRRGLMVQPQVQLNLEVKWKQCAPLITQGKVLLAAPDGATLDCLDLWTGALLWRVSRNDGDLYLGGAWKERVLVVGHRRCEALRLRDGESVWGAETAEPSGQGVLADGRYYLPVKSDPKTGGPAIQTIDLEKGAVVGRIPLPRGDVPGNLVLSGGALISQTATRVSAYPCATEKKAE